VEYHCVPYQAPAVVLVGWERKGLSRELQRLCDVVVRIPMVGPGDSLNVAAATALVLYEFFHQRQGRLPATGEPTAQQIQSSGQG
jgi:RNA methyltransferase, TrmH family